MNDSPHIFVLATDFRPMKGGVAEYLHQLWNNVARDHPVTVVTTVQCAEDTWEHDYRLEQLPPLPQRQLGARFGDSFMPLRKMNTARYFAQLRKNARHTIDRITKQALRCEAYVGIWDTAAHFWCQELYSAGIAYSLHAHGLDVLVPLYGRLPEWRTRDFRNAKAIYANSSATARLVRNKIGNCTSIDVVRPGVGPTPDSSATTLEAVRLRSTLGLESKPVLLTLARLVRRKGIDLVLRCIPGLLSKYPDLHYLVAGEGPEKDSLQTLAHVLGIGGHVHFIGQTGEITKWALYEMCDAFVMPNRLLDGTDWEGFGIVFLEAALSGKPAIGGKNGGVPEAIEDGVTGLLVDPEDMSALSAAIASLLGNDRMREEMGAHAVQRARSQFEWSVVAGPLVSRINESNQPLLAGRKGL
jgi:phosphatidylinositol alpha-1,6-mannosyltransferase